MNNNEEVYFINYLENFVLRENKYEQAELFNLEDNVNSISNVPKTSIEKVTIGDISTNRYINEYWTSKQRKSNSIHEISYRACFKAQLPRFFIDKLSSEGDYVYDPFLGRGTTIIEASLMNRKVIGNDINPLSKVLSEPRLLIPDLIKLDDYLKSIPIDYSLKADIDLSMFYHPKTESELMSIRNYILSKQAKNDLDKWIMMIATNRLTGHSAGFFSVYSMPPNQAVSAERQKKINEKRNQIPDYRDVKRLIMNKSISLLKDITPELAKQLKTLHKSSIFLNNDARETNNIKDESIQLTVTSPPFLDVIQYAKDNWLRCWFNGIDAEKVGENITMSKTVEDWSKVMQDVFHELYRVTKKEGYVAFEVGEVKNGKIKLDDYVLPLGINAGFRTIGIIINEQEFTKTANIWGVNNNSKGTNSNRIVLFRKDK